MSDADLRHDPHGDPATPQVPGTGHMLGIPSPLLVAVGIGGRIEVTFDEIRLVKGGLFGHVVDLLRLGYGVTENTIPIRTIAAVEIVKPMLMPDFIRFSYPGSPSLTGNYIDDALAENALVMSWLDNRPFYRIKAWIDRWPYVSPMLVATDG